jgi:hypothetical protein
MLDFRYDTVMNLKVSTKTNTTFADFFTSDLLTKDDLSVECTNGVCKVTCGTCGISNFNLLANTDSQDLITPTTEGTTRILASSSSSGGGRSSSSSSSSSSSRPTSSSTSTSSSSSRPTSSSTSIISSSSSRPTSSSTSSFFFKLILSKLNWQIRIYVNK